MANLHFARGTDHHRAVAAALQHNQTPQCYGLPPARPENYHPDGSKAGHALTYKLDQSMGVGQVEYYTNNRVTDLSLFPNWLPIEKGEPLRTIHENARGVGYHNTVSQRALVGLENHSNPSTVKYANLANYGLGISLELNRLTTEQKETEYKLIARGWVDDKN